MTAFFALCLTILRRNHVSNAYMLHALGITHVVSVGECVLVPPPNTGMNSKRCSARSSPAFEVHMHSHSLRTPLLLTPTNILDACTLNFNPTITLMDVSKSTNCLSPEASVVEGGQPPRHLNCPPGTFINTVVISPVEWDLYLCSHQGILGTSKSAHYNVQLNENSFTCVHCLHLCSFFTVFSSGLQNCYS
jgi:hypothetical protein